MRFVAQSAENLASQVAAAAMVFVVTVVVARVLGPSGRGQLALLLTVPWLAAIPLEAGLGMSGVAAVTGGRMSLADLRVAISPVLILLAVGALVGQASPIVRLCGEVLPGLGSLGVRAVIAASFTTAMLSLARYMQIAGGCLHRFNVLIVVDKALLLGALLALVAANRLTADSLAIGTALAYGASAAFALVMSRLPCRFEVRVSWVSLRQLTSTGWRVALANGLQALNYRLDVLVLNLMAGVATVGVYSVATSLGSLLWYVPSAAGTVLLGRVGAKGRIQGSRMAANASQFGVVIVVVLATCLVVFGKPLIEVLFGSEFTAAYTVLLLLLPGVVALSWPKIINSYLVVYGHAGVAVLGSGIAVVATIALDLVLISRWGAGGAAVASSVAYLLFAVVFIAGFQRVTGRHWRELMPDPRSWRHMFGELVR